MISPPLCILQSVAMSRFIGKKRTSIFTTYLIKKSCSQKYRGLDQRYWPLGSRYQKYQGLVLKSTGVLLDRIGWRFRPSAAGGSSMITLRLAGAPAWICFVKILSPVSCIYMFKYYQNNLCSFSGEFPFQYDGDCVEFRTRRVG